MNRSQIKKVLAFITGAIFLVACGTSESFEIHQSGLEYYFPSKGPSNMRPQKGDLLVLKLKYYNSKDSLLFTTDEINNEFRMQMKEPSHSGGCIEDAFAMMAIGDSMIARIDAADFYSQTRHIDIPEFIQDGEKLRFEIKLLDLKKVDEIADLVRGVKVVDEVDEMQQLKEYLNLTNVTEEPTSTGLYIVEMKEGSGDYPVNGDVVSIHYLATFISGKPFSNTYQSGMPFRFELGTGEVIDGLDEGVRNVKKGGQARLIIPSKLAYGNEGKGDKIPPFSTLIFEIELLDINAK